MVGNVILTLERRPGENRLRFDAETTTGFSETFVSDPVPDNILQQLQTVGLRGFRSQTRFHEVVIQTPILERPPAPDTPSVGMGMFPGLRLSGTRGARYDIQYSYDLSDGSWKTIDRVTLGAVTQEWVDKTAAGAAARYYRLVPIE